MTKIRSAILGYPRIGEKRELKRATESYWKGEISQDELLKTAAQLRAQNWKKIQDTGIDFIPSNDFSFYDQVLDMSALLGNVPARFNWKGGDVDWDTYFLMARGSKESSKEKETQACEMTKWFDTNYHYIVPEFTSRTKFKISSQKIFSEFQEAKKLGITTRPVLLGPVSYLTLGKSFDQDPNFNQFALLDNLINVYVEILSKLKEQGAEWVQIDEPAAVLDLNQTQKDALRKVYQTLTAKSSGLKIMVAAYFGDLRDNLQDFLSLPVDAFHIDAVRGASELDKMLAGVPKDKILSVGIVNGRNIWKNNLKTSLDILNKAKAAMGENLIVSSSCSLMHSPITLKNEAKLDAEIKEWLAFADQKLQEIKFLADAVNGDIDEGFLAENQKAQESRKNSAKIHRPNVKQRLAAVKEQDFKRASAFPERAAKQHAKLNLPLFPTTTIGSFPQTAEVRSLRARNKKGELSNADYEKALEEETKKTIAFQEEIGLDMLVHGEYERNDMVEYFGELLDGFTFTQNGWVQSYGSRYVKPPVIFGDVQRPSPMTVRWSKFAQSLTKKPMKGMLTGPVTILQWSFVRDDQPRKDTTNQIALAIRDEVVDLEAAGIPAIQIDEPAIREGLPLRRADWNDYLNWAVKAFRLSACGVKDETQIHTHMCYSEFNDMIESIADMDADVISIEASRSKMELLQAFVNDFNYPNEIGPGVYDIHSPRVPSEEEMKTLLQKAVEVIPKNNLWVNPDCGLKTRRWEEVKPSLVNMVGAARQMREESQVAA